MNLNHLDEIKLFDFNLFIDSSKINLLSYRSKLNIIVFLNLSFKSSKRIDFIVRKCNNSIFVSSCKI